jgi:hypothetical protein
MSCSGSHLGITINIKNKKFVKDLPMIDTQFRFNQYNSFREEYISVFFPYGPVLIRPYGENVSKCFFSETTWTIETKLPRNDHWKVLYNFFVFYADRKSKIAATAGHRLTMDPMGKCSNAFFSETTNMIKVKLYECSLDDPLQLIKLERLRVV